MILSSLERTSTRPRLMMYISRPTSARYTIVSPERYNNEWKYIKNTGYIVLKEIRGGVKVIAF